MNYVLKIYDGNLGQKLFVIEEGRWGGGCNKNMKDEKRSERKNHWLIVLD